MPERVSLATGLGDTSGVLHPLEEELLAGRREGGSTPQRAPALPGELWVVELGDPPVPEPRRDRPVEVVARHLGMGAAAEQREKLPVRGSIDRAPLHFRMVPEAQDLQDHGPELEGTFLLRLARGPPKVPGSEEPRATRRPARRALNREARQVPSPP